MVAIKGLAENEKAPPINPNPQLQQYYHTLESRIGYKVLLRDTRHYGYYDKPDDSPFPISGALRAMENRLMQALDCPEGSSVLDAGCGVGHVALYMAQAGGYHVQGIDVVEHHIAKAQRNIVKAGMTGTVSARIGDYHHLENFANSSFDGVYTMETLVHSTDASGVLREFFRVLKPGGRIALHEYDFEDRNKCPKDFAESLDKVHTYAAMPANYYFSYGALRDLLQQAGFEDVHLTDLSEHVVPMLWFFYVLAIVPWLLFRLLGVEHRFVNTIAAVQGYRGRSVWRYVEVTGRKPLNRRSMAKEERQASWGSCEY